MQTSIQSMPCATEELARANVASMLTQAASQEGNVKIINIDVREVDGMYIAVAVYQTVDLEAEEKEDEKQGEGDFKDSKTAEEDRDAEGTVLYTGTLEGAPPPVEVVPELPSGELLAEQSDSTAYESTTQNSAPIEPLEPLSPPTGPEALTPDPEFLSDKLMDDFEEAEVPAYNVDKDRLAVERASAAVEGLDAREREQLKAEIEKKLKEGVPPESAIPDTGAKPAATT